MGDIERPGPGWANDAVFGRFPSGTDPREALREVLTAAHERTDGTNALPWWLRAGVTWWHGSRNGIRVGEDLMPPALTGILRHIDSSDPNSVYVTLNREDAIMYACWHRAPMLYEVTFSAEPQPDDVIDDQSSFRVPKATVRKMHGIKRHEVEAALNRVFAQLPEGD